MLYIVYTFFFFYFILILCILPITYYCVIYKQRNLYVDYRYENPVFFKSHVLEEVEEV